jgi:hypothetical protein
MVLNFSGGDGRGVSIPDEGLPIFLRGDEGLSIA